MTSGPRQLLMQLIAAADGEIVGRVRLQKIAYLLEQSGLGAGLPFSYHHYGPYSRQLDEAIDAARALGMIEEQVKARAVDGAPFSVFRARSDAVEETLGAIPSERARGLIATMKAVPSTVIELAATIHWLVARERVPDWRAELRRRKGPKCDDGRTERAIALLRALDLDVTAQAEAG